MLYDTPQADLMEQWNEFCDASSGCAGSRRRGNRGYAHGRLDGWVLHFCSTCVVSSLRCCSLRNESNPQTLWRAVSRRDTQPQAIQRSEFIPSHPRCGLRESSQSVRSIPCVRMPGKIAPTRRSDLAVIRHTAAYSWESHPNDAPIRRVIACVVHSTKM